MISNHTSIHLNNPIVKTESFYGYVKDVSEALILFEASRLGMIPLITTRLSETTRTYIRPGSIFVWEIGVGGMKRWTDGHTWSPSRYNNYFFIYHELDTDITDNATTSKAETYKKDGLMKRTSSISTVDGRKFQLVNYVYNDVEKNISLPTISTYPISSSLIIPINFYYRPKNVIKKRNNSMDSNSENINVITCSAPTTSTSATTSGESIVFIPYQNQSLFMNDN